MARPPCSGPSAARATAASTANRRRPTWCRLAPRGACSACSGLVGSMQVIEALKLILGVGEPLAGLCSSTRSDALPHGPGAQGPGLRGVRREPGSRADRLRRVLRSGVGGGRRGRHGLHDQRQGPGRHAGREATKSSSSTSASRTSTRSSPSPARRSSPRASSCPGPRWRSCRRTSGSCCTARAAPVRAESAGDRQERRVLRRGARRRRGTRPDQPGRPRHFRPISTERAGVSRPGPPVYAPPGRSPMKGDRVEIVIDSGEGDAAPTR